MALDASKLVRLGPQNRVGFSVWTYYAGADTNAQVDAAGYFSAVADRLQKGDWILVSGNSNAAWGIHIVNSNTRDLTATPPVFGAVDVSNAVAFGAIDSD